MAIEAINSSSVGYKQVVRPNLKTSQNFTSKTDVDEEKSNATKYMIGATALAAVIGLGIAGYKGKLGKTVQEFLGGAEKAAEKETSKAGKETPKIKPEAEPTVKVDPEVKTKTEVGPTVKQESEITANTDVDVLIAKKNEEMVKFGVDGKVFRDKNNPEHIVSIKKTNDGYYKTISGIENFLNNDDKFLEITSTRKDFFQKTYANGAMKKITRKPNKSGKYISTSINSPDSKYSYLKGTNYNENGKLIKSSECVQTSDMLTACNSEQPGFTEVKKEAFESLRKGLDWQE